MDQKKSLLEYAKSEEKCRVSWSGYADFFADNKGNLCEEKIQICLAGHRFFVGNNRFTVSFSVRNLCFRGFCKKTDALLCSKDGKKEFRNISPLTALFSDSVRTFEFNDKYVCFIKTKEREFEQILDVVSAKYKYSLSANS